MYQIVSDGACDLGLARTQELGVEVVPFYVSMDSALYQKEIEELDIREFYQFMVYQPKQFPKTSMPSIQDYIQVFEKIAKQGQDIICLCITAKFSGSYNSANNAKMMIEEKYPDCKVAIIDTTLITIDQGMMVEKAVTLKNEGCSYDETIKQLQALKETGRIFFTIGGMDYLVHGGRVGKLSGIAAGALGIKPIILLQDGEIFNAGLSRGRKKSLKKVNEEMMKYFKENQLDPNDYRFTIGYGYDQDEAFQYKKQLEELLLKEYPDFHQSIGIGQIGATIGVHTGPYPIGVGIIKK